MKLITQHKTTTLIQLALSDSNAIIVCFNSDEVKRVKKLLEHEYNHKDIKVLRYEDVLKYPMNYRNNNLYIDNADIILELIFNHSVIKAITMTIDNETSPEDIISSSNWSISYTHK